MIHSEYRSQNFELNDTIRWRNWTFNVGLLASNDTLYGQGLKRGRLGAVRLRARAGQQVPDVRHRLRASCCSRASAPSGPTTPSGTVYASYARYIPAASSLPRAASWARNLAATIHAYFDADGVLFATDPEASSSGKLFVEDMTPRRADEFLLGTARQLGPRWSARALRPLPQGQPLLGGHQQRRARALRPAGRDSRASSTSRPAGPPRPDRQRLVLRHRRARRRLHQVLRGDRRDRVARRQDLRPRLLHLEQVLRQLRPGQLDRRATTRTSSSAPRTSATTPAASSGTSSTAACAATAGTC